MSSLTHPPATFLNLLSERTLTLAVVSINAILIILLLFSSSTANTNDDPCGNFHAEWNFVSSETQQPSSHSLGSTVPENRMVCSAAQIARQVEHVRQKLENPPFGCADPINVLPFLKAYWATKTSSLVLVNIGANKGYDIVEWMNTWQPELQVTPDRWNQKLLEIQDTQPVPEHIKGLLCGVCGLCHENIDLSHNLVSPDWKPTVVRIVGVEPMPQNVKMLQALHSLSSGKFTLIAAGVGEQKGTAFIPDRPPGYEDQGVSKQAADGFAAINVTTVDDIMASQKLEKIHFLKIDTEGFDPKVLRGARKTLRQNLVQFIEFEYHKVWAAEDTLKNVVEELDVYGYDCYLKSDITLVRLTGCFDPSFEFRLWSNVYCSLRKEIVLSAYLLSRSLVEKE